jgi:ketosteroid isomerase-like protein
MSAARETVVDNVLDYVAAWNEADAGARLKILEDCWAEDAVYVDPNVELKGRAALSEHISTVQAGRPGARIEMMSGVDVHHNVVRFLWRLVRADGSSGDISIDFGEVDAAGRLTKIAGFFGEPPKT